jgi:ketosteroid isomerase-like protein
MPDGNLGTAYQALRGGNNGPLLALLGDDFEWVEPDLAGYPLAGIHRGPDGVEGVLARFEALFDNFEIEAHEVAEAGERETVTGVIRGRPSGSEQVWELPFAHVWELNEEDEFIRMRPYFDRSRLTIAAARRQLADVADDLIEQAVEIRRQWAQLGDALRAAGAEPPEGADPSGEGGEREPEGSASARLAAVDMAHDGASRDEVETYLRDELSVEDPAPILEEVFATHGAPPPPPPGTLQERTAALEATRLGRLFARNRG